MPLQPSPSLWGACEWHSCREPHGVKRRAIGALSQFRCRYARFGGHGIGDACHGVSRLSVVVAGRFADRRHRGRTGSPRHPGPMPGRCWQPSLTIAPRAKLSATIARFCSSDQRRRCSGPVITSTRAIPPSLALVQALSFAPMLPDSSEPTSQCKAALTGWVRWCRHYCQQNSSPQAPFPRRSTQFRRCRGS